MSEQGFVKASGKEAVKGWLDSVFNLIAACVEIQLSDIARHKYANGLPEGVMIFTLPDGTIRGNINGVIEYLLNIVYESKTIGMDLVDLLIREIKKIDMEVSEDVM